MTVEEVIQKAEAEVGGKVISLGECEDRWILGFDWQSGTLSSIVWCCYKDTGEIGGFFPPDEPGVLKSAKPIVLPKRK